MTRSGRPRPRSLAEELGAQEEHRKWIRWQRKDPEDRERLAPPPAYKDCVNCQFSKRATVDRQDECQPCIWEEATEWEAFPSGPPVRFYFIEELTQLPDLLVVAMLERGEITYQDVKDRALMLEHHRLQTGGGIFG